MFATSPHHQGKGYGKKLLQFMGKLADADKVETYLEADGERNVGFYNHVENFEDIKAYTTAAGKEIYEDFGGTHAMVRKPVDPSTTTTANVKVS